MFEVWMSRSAIPAALSAARTRSIRAAFWLIAAVALAERVMTPAEMIATSGTRLTSPVALTSSRVPEMVWTNGCTTDCVWPIAGAATAASARAAKKACFIWMILMWTDMAREFARAPWLFAERLLLARRSGRPAAQDQAIDEQDDE